MKELKFFKEVGIKINREIDYKKRNTSIYFEISKDSWLVKIVVQIKRNIKRNIISIYFLISRKSNNIYIFFFSYN